jgi:hypothetical protein
LGGPHIKIPNRRKTRRDPKFSAENVPVVSETGALLTPEFVHRNIFVRRTN